MYQNTRHVRIAGVGGDGKARLVSRRRIFEGRLVTLDVDRVIEPSGMEVEREILRHPGAAVLLAVTDERKVVLVRQYRHAAGELMLEAPAGTIDAGEEPAETARRELVEETGYFPNRLEKLTQFFPSPGVLEELMHLYLATDLERRVGSLDDDESLEPVELEWEQALALEIGKDVRDAKTIIALSYLRTHPLFT
jgi:ADP-ribose pyrophosphatase